MEVLVKTRNIRLGSEERIQVEVLNKGDKEISGTVWVFVDEHNFSRNITINPDSGVKEIFRYKPDKTGEHKVTVIFDSEIPAGPRYYYFRVYGRQRGRQDCGEPPWKDIIKCFRENRNERTVCYSMVKQKLRNMKELNYCR